MATITVPADKSCQVGESDQVTLIPAGRTGFSRNYAHDP